MNNHITRFFRESGLKVLAIADLNACEYSILFYLLNCAMSGLDNLITNESELASIIGHNALDVRDALDRLSGRHIVKCNYGDGTQSPKLQSLSLGMNWEISKWQIGQNQIGATTSDHHEALIFPFRRGAPNLQILEGQRHQDSFERPIIHRPASEIEAWHRIFESFSRGRNMDEYEYKTTEKVAETLSHAHPVDQVLLMIRHFGQRIPTLSLLASNWAHYAEQYEQENQKLDLFEVRQKQFEMDQKVRDASTVLLEKRVDLDLSEEEIQVLELLAHHRHPRRQLFWAHQQRIRYPKLTSFFADVHSLMLPITQTGQVVKMSTD